MKLRAAIVLAVALGCVVTHAALGAVDARLQGKFTMRGRITFVDSVYGEYPGEPVLRGWTFSPRCGSGVCRRITLFRRRSGRHILNVIVLKRRAPGVYVGRGGFWVALRCAGQVLPHGGLARERITVRITQTQMVGTTPFATAVRARYSNPSRLNLTRCPGSIGHDAARYGGRLTSPLPGPPAASFTDTVNATSTSAAFSDTSTPGSGGGQIVSWLWNFGDSGSSSNTSTARDPTHQFSAPGTYTVTLQVQDAFGQTATTSSQVTV